MKDINKDNSVMVLATRFQDRGDWTVDQQFVLYMGSSYLLAHGIGTPLAKDAVTTVSVPEDGEYNLYVRTRNWTKYWSEGPTPGIFKVKIDGKSDRVIFGTGKSASTGKVTPQWCWQKGSRISLKKGKHTLALHDLMGLDGRCDAILLTAAIDAATGKPFIPGDSLGEYKQLRKTLLGDETPVSKGTFDFVVIGGGIAGECAALAAARFGAKVALIQDRYVLGGNNSSEIRVALGGRINLPPYPSLGYLVNEIGPENGGNARGAFNYEDDRKLKSVENQKNITLFLGYTVVEVAKDGNKIKSVVALEATDQTKIKVSGHTFADCTGDATLATMAGAETMMGRESRSLFGESLAPEEADRMTMGGSIEWYCEDWNTPCTFPDSLEWGLELNENNIEAVHRANWYWEVGMHYDQIADSEKVRDYGMYVAYSTFSYCKNRYSQKESWLCTHLTWVSHVVGKRESRRIVGDYILKEQDIRKQVHHDDGTACLSWNIDQHFPKPVNSENFPGNEWLSDGHLTPVDPYPIPYRCFYSKDVPNMFMAGRDISVTHVALGATRVMRTCGMIGEVVGMAASICARKKVLPRDIYTTYFTELQEIMHKGAGRTDIQYNQFYVLIDNTAKQIESI